MEVLNRSDRTMKEKEVVEKIYKDLMRLETTVNSEKYEVIFQSDALRRAFKAGSFSEKIELLISCLLKKIGAIPAVSINDYRVDAQFREDIQSIKKNLITLESFLTEEAGKDEKNNYCYDTIKKFPHKYELKEVYNGYIAFLVETLDKGGVEQVVAILATEFYKRGIKLQVWCLQSGGDVAESLIKMGIEVHIFENDASKFKQYVKRFPPKLVNTHFVRRYIKFIYEQGIPVVEVIHNMYVFFSGRMIRTERRNEKYYAKMIAVSEIVKETYNSRIIESDKIEVIGNAAILRGIPLKSRNEVRKNLKIPESGVVLLNVGSIDSRKNQIGIAQAFDLAAQLSDIPIYLVLAGNIQEDSYKDKLLKVIDECNSREHIILLPYYRQIRELYQMADVFVMDSYYEGWSIAATEALYEGLPIIHSMCGSAQELVDNGRYGITVPNPLERIKSLSIEQILNGIERGYNDNLRELVKAMLTIINDRDKWQRRRNKIAQEARSQFSTNEMCEKYLELFEKICVKDV